ncbi:hypothetical protein CIB93_28285 [Streptomyces sp. WZ.A104]|uniref:hypothetical protein n=1 Tax=Streptomyces sp. WZ.A104 TaxID=2023771 RepID=UPI000BBC5A8D|nr:hypothetical protein [Streptomyces sp. WZ.A104]PCG82730.1 hypothetical protein CIB93_28285 [Streptomyces sp. WZ.A104]
MATKSTWKVFARVEKNGKYAEYDDVATIHSPSGVPTAKDVLAAQLTEIIRQNPHLRGGRITGTATRIN